MAERVIGRTSGEPVRYLLLELPWPPSVNQMYMAVVRKSKSRRGNGKATTISSPLYGKYKEDCEEVLGFQKYKQFPKTTRLKATLWLFPPNKRGNWDVDNRCKAILDVLQANKVFHNDSQIDYVEMIRCDPTKYGRVIVELEIMEQKIIVPNFDLRFYK